MNKLQFAYTRQSFYLGFRVIIEKILMKWDVPGLNLVLLSDRQNFSSKIMLWSENNVTKNSHFPASFRYASV